MGGSNWRREERDGRNLGREGDFGGEFSEKEQEEDEPVMVKAATTLPELMFSYTCRSSLLVRHPPLFAHIICVHSIVLRRTYDEMAARLMREGCCV